MLDMSRRPREDAEPFSPRRDASKAGVGRVGRWQDDRVSLKSAAICIATATTLLVDAQEMIARSRSESKALRERAVDQARLAIRIIDEFIATNQERRLGGDATPRMRSRDMASNREVGVQRYHERRNAGLCPRCGAAAASDSVHCPQHRDAVRARKARP